MGGGVGVTGNKGVFFLLIYLFGASGVLTGVSKIIRDGSGKSNTFYF
jgi:hypothetical protein